MPKILFTTCWKSEILPKVTQITVEYFNPKASNQSTLKLVNYYAYTVFQSATPKTVFACTDIFFTDFSL